MMRRGLNFFGRLAFLSVLVSGHGLIARAADEMIVPAVTLYPGDKISSEQLLVKQKPAYLRPVQRLVQNVDQMVGKTPVRVLPAGKPVLTSFLALPKLVKPGTTIRTYFQSGGITILGVAQSLQAGSYGDLVQARNLGSGVVITGYVQHDGSLRIMP
ncbi:MAG: flagellar basal body P-ring formation chaperone FlgA [Anderseniella sp.]